MTPQLVETPIPPTPTLAPPPAQASLASPPYEKQAANNCGPAALSMMLHMVGWTGDQKTISDVIKPVNGDRNVNPEELAYWVRNYAGWLRVEYRVGGDLETLKRLIAAGYPVIIEGTTSLNPDDTGWPDDDLWAAHYLLLTGYDDTARTFVAQDPYKGPDKTVPYEQIESEWKPFNYLYMIVYLPDKESDLQTLLGSNWDAGLNRLHALDIAQAAAVKDPADAFAWFNVGSNMVYFERYDEANQAYDKARELGLPQRMFRYQFGPFIANFQASRTDDLLALTGYALERTDMSEETWLWHGWALYRKGDSDGAVKTGAEPWKSTRVIRMRCTRYHLWGQRRKLWSQAASRLQEASSLHSIWEIHEKTHPNDHHPLHPFRLCQTGSSCRYSAHLHGNVHSCPNDRDAVCDS